MRPILILLLAAATCLVPAASTHATSREAIDDSIVLRAARTRALPRQLSPPRQAALDQVIAHFQRDDTYRGAQEFARFASEYFRQAHLEDLEQVVLFLVKQGFLANRPELLDLAERAAWLEDRAIGVAQHLDQLEEARRELRNPRSRTTIAPLDLAGLDPDPFNEPVRWLPGRPMTPDDIRRERIRWEKKLVMAQEDAIAARVRLQGRVQAEAATVRRLSISAMQMIEAGALAGSGRR